MQVGRHERSALPWLMRRAHVWGNTATYEAYMGCWSRPVAGAVLAWLGLRPGLSWLDVGCGTRALTEAILAAADPREIFGVDPSADFIATAAQIADPRGLGSWVSWPFDQPIQRGRPDISAV